MSIPEVSPLQTANANPNNDVLVCDPPADSIQAIRWSPTNNVLACASWDCSVKAYQVDSETACSSKLGEYQNAAPVLDVAWSNDGENVISGGCDNLVKIWEPSRPRPSIVGFHDKAVRTIAVSDDQIISGGWDKKLKCWDPKQCASSTVPNHRTLQQLKPTAHVALSDRVYAMDMQYPLLAVALANKKVVVYDVRNLAKPMQEIITLLKHQLRCIAIFPNQEGLAVGSVEGRCAVHFLITNKDKKEKEFAFECHRKDQDVFAVNSLRFHQHFGTFASAGGDGNIVFYDKDKKQKLKEFKQMPLPVTDVDFNFNGELFAYSTSYDWSKGIEHFQPKLQKPQIFVHKLAVADIRPKTDS